jgi:filamentous hemagglutinin family protein
MKSPPLLTIVLLIISLSINAEITTDGSLGSHANLPGPDYLIGADLGQQMGSNLFHSFQEFNLNSLESATFSGPNNVQNILSRVTGGNPSNIDGLIRSTIPNANFYFLNPYGIVFGENARLDVQGSFHASTADYLRLGENGRFDARNPSDSLLTVAPIESFGFLDNSHGKIEVNGRAALDLESGTPRALLQVPEGKSISLIGGEIHFSQGVDELPLERLDEGSPEEFQARQYRNQRFSQLYAPSGYVNLASIRQAGKIALTKNGIHSTATQGGHIQLEQESYISSTGESGGNVFIRAGQFMMDNSTIYARTLGTQDGGVVDIQADNIELTQETRIQGGTENLGDGTGIQLSATESINLSNNSQLNTNSGDYLKFNQQLGDAGHIHLQAKDIELNGYNSNRGAIDINTYGTGQGGDLHISAENSLNIIEFQIQIETWGDDAQAGQAGDIYLRANTLNVEQGSWVRTIGDGADSGQLVVQAGTIYLGKQNGDDISYLGTEGIGGNAGQVIIQADDILLEDGAQIGSFNYGNANAGHIDIQLTGNLTIRGASDTGYQTGIFSSVWPDEENASGGNAGNINISAKEMRVESGGMIDADTVASHSTSSGKAGNVTLKIKNTLVLSGVNPYGEHVDGFGSMISARSQGENAGSAGNIHIQAGSVSILDGALLEIGTNNNSHGGNVQIQADQQITIHGDATQILLNDPEEAQLDYLSAVNPKTYNQSTSGIYARSTSPAENSGDSGKIELTTPSLRLSNQGQISTASQGGGKAGQIILNVEKLILSDNALIRSNSDLSNQFAFDTISARDNTVIDSGTVVKTNDIGNGKATYQINLGNTLLNLMPITQVADMTALENLPAQIQFKQESGDILIVENAGNGQPARFLYMADANAKETWTRINEDDQITLEQPNFLLIGVDFRSDNTSPPYADGTQIHIKDMGNGKSADFVYVLRTYLDGPNKGAIRAETLRVKYYQVADTTALQDLATRIDLVIGTQVDVSHAENGNPAHFVFDGNGWVSFGQVVEVPDMEAQQNLILAKPGHIAHIPTGDTIYTGNEWIDLGQTYRVSNLAERNSLKVQQGDLVKVANVDDGGYGHFHSFLYADGKWIEQIRGGNAGQIVINADSIQLTDGSEISTGSISGGGGSVTLNVDKLVYLTDSQVSTSVQEGVGSGGDLSLNPEFVILENGKIIARANEGQGGNINITTTGIYTFPPKSTSTIDASSKLGIDGEVNVESPDVNIDDFLVILPGGFSEVKLKQCTNEEIENPSTFKVDLIRDRKGLPFGKFLKLK